MSDKVKKEKVNKFNSTKMANTKFIPDDSGKEKITKEFYQKWLKKLY